MKTPATEARRKQAPSEGFIGKPVEVKRSACRAVHGLQGVILDETQNTFLVQTANGRKTVPKRNTTFQIGRTVFEGNDALARPEEKLKKFGSKGRNHNG